MALSEKLTVQHLQPRNFPVYIHMPSVKRIKFSKIRSIKAHLV